MSISLERVARSWTNAMAATIRKKITASAHAGTAAVLNTVALHRDAQVTVYERNDNISFLSCGIALHVQGVVKDPAGLFYCSPEKLAELGVKTCMRHEVTEVDLTKKKLRVRDLDSGGDFEDTFDKLIVTSGSSCRYSQPSTTCWPG